MSDTAESSSEPANVCKRSGKVLLIAIAALATLFALHSTVISNVHRGVGPTLKGGGSATEKRRLNTGLNTLDGDLRLFNGDAALAAMDGATVPAIYDTLQADCHTLSGDASYLKSVNGSSFSSRTKRDFTILMKDLSATIGYCLQSVHRSPAPLITAVSDLHVTIGSEQRLKSDIGMSKNDKSTIRRHYIDPDAKFLSAFRVVRSALTSFNDDAHTASQTGSTKDLVAVASDCQRLHDTVVSLEVVPIPADEVSSASLIKKAEVNWLNGSSLCVHAFQDNDPGALSQVFDDFTAAGTDLNQADGVPANESSPAPAATPTTTNSTKAESPVGTEPQPSGYSGSVPTSTTEAPEQAPTASSTTTTTLGPDGLTAAEEKFVNDITAQVPVVASAIAAGFPTRSSVGEEGAAICQQFVSEILAHGPLGYNDYVTDITQGLTGWNVTLNQDEAQIVMSLAIEDECPAYVNAIPAGDPGASG